MPTSARLKWQSTDSTFWVGGESLRFFDLDDRNHRREAPTLEHAVREWYDAGHSQRAIARDLKIDRREVKRIIEQPAEA